MISRRICWAEKKLVEVLHHSSDDRTFIIDHQTECDKKLAINYYPCWHYTLLETVQCTAFPVLFGAKKRLPHFSYTPDWRIPFVRLKTGITINYRGGLGRGCRGAHPLPPPPEMTCGFLIQLFKICCSSEMYSEQFTLYYCLFKSLLLRIRF